MDIDDTFLFVTLSHVVSGEEKCYEPDAVAGTVHCVSGSLPLQMSPASPTEIKNVDKDQIETSDCKNLSKN
ncbi:hypothetical protein VNO77_21350 [Canavalia gladiata]|uniref:Uncharacterized protein n=1 Tax=Canavalia gladiata TaxID=3824 RepID=A0AAN9QNB7_CANGL